MPGAEDVVREIVGGIDLDGFGGFIEDDFRVAYSLFAALGPLQPAQNHRQHVMAVRFGRIGANRALGVDTPHGV